MSICGFVTNRGNRLGGEGGHWCIGAMRRTMERIRVDEVEPAGQRQESERCGRGVGIRCGTPARVVP